MKFKLFLSTAILSGVMAVTASAAVSKVGADGRVGEAVTNWTSDTDQKTVLTVNPGDTFSFTVAEPGEYVTVITYIEGDNVTLGNDTILYVNQYAAESGDYEANAATFEVKYKVREGLANGVYRLEVNSGSGSTEKVWYKLGRSDLSDKVDGMLYAKYVKYSDTQYSAGYKATYKGCDGASNTKLDEIGFEIRYKNNGTVSSEAKYSKVDLDNFTTSGDVSYGMTVSGIDSFDEINNIVVTPYTVYSNTPTVSTDTENAQ